PPPPACQDGARPGVQAAPMRPPARVAVRDGSTEPSGYRSPGGLQTRPGAPTWSGIGVRVSRHRHMPGRSSLYKPGAKLVHTMMRDLCALRGVISALHGYLRSTT